MLIFTVCLAQFNSTRPPLLLSVTDSSFHISLFDEEANVDKTAFSLPLPWFPVPGLQRGWEHVTCWERHRDNTA